MVGRPAAVRQSKNMAKPQDPRVPRSVEEYLIERVAYLSERGAGIGGALGGASGTGAARAGERGGRRNAQRAHTVVEERAGSVALTGEQVRERIISAAPRAKRPPATHVLRWRCRWARVYAHRRRCCDHGGRRRQPGRPTSLRQRQIVVAGIWFDSATGGQAVVSHRAVGGVQS